MTRFAIALVGLAAMLACFAVGPQMGRAAGLDVWSAADARAEHRAALEVQDDLEAEVQNGFACSQANDHVIAALIDGELSLDEAVRQLHCINRTRDGFENGLRVHFQDCPLREAYVRMAFNQIAQKLDGDAARRTAVMERLECEWREMSAEHLIPAM